MVDVASVPTFAELDQFPETVPMLQNGWQPTGGPVDPEDNQGLLNWPLRELTDRTRYLKTRIDNMAVKAADLVTVGAGGEFLTINEALIALSERRPAYKPGGFITELRLLSGFIMAEQVLISGLNMGWITITGDDAETFIDRAYLTQQFGIRIPAFGVLDGGVLPRIGQLFTMMNTGSATDRCGVLCGDGGGATVLGGAGVKLAGADGANVAMGGRLSATGAIFSNAGENGINAGGSTTVSAIDVDVSGCAVRGVLAQNLASVNIGNGICTGAGSVGIEARDGAIIYAGNAQCRKAASDSTSDIVATRGSRISAYGAIGGTNIAVNTLTANGIIYR
ncbi:hypothetical protein [Paracoccus litorisediminis]|uniref:Uncharacterized protein n=1 Tax=Paracoccus litorisediminis TaxID=2006130 RepID=A0A844HKD2_9RHOB|nr:hypothetical protein [Paracoccus litorisediminis]MTH60653.1 hypothetical protein [Paracoccus litorisediminis]